MIQDIQPHQFDNQYRPCPPDAQSYALYYEGQSTLLKKRKDGIDFPRFRDLERLNEEIYEEEFICLRLTRNAFIWYRILVVNGCQSLQWRIKNLSVMQNRSILHLPELPVIS